MSFAWRSRWPWVAAFLLFAVAAFGLREHFAGPGFDHQGPFKLVQLTSNGAEEPLTAAAISPDGKLVAYADPQGLMLEELGVKARSLRVPGPVEVRRIEWFPDRRHLLVSAMASSTHTPQMWSISSGDDAPLLIHDGAELGVPSPDGLRVAYTRISDSAITTLWTSDAGGGNETRVNTMRQGESYPVLLWSADARKLILGEVGTLPGAAKVQTGDPAAERTAHRLVVIDIEKHVETAALDGIALAAACLWGKSSLLFACRLNGLKGMGLWRVDVSPETGAPVAPPLQLQLVEDVVALSRSADGHEIAAVFRKAQPDVYVATLSQPPSALTELRRVTFGDGQDYPQAWTPDSKSVIFESNENGKVGSAFDIYRQAIDGPPQPEPLVTDEMVQVLPQQSPEGKWILFASKPKWLSGEPYALYRVPEAGGAPVKIDVGGPLDEYRCPLSGRSCVLRETEGHTAFHYYALDPVAGKGRLLCSTPWTETLIWNWSVSPGAAQVALPVQDATAPRIRVVPCAGGKTAEGTREIPVNVGEPLMEVTWAAVTAGVQKLADLFYVGKDGSATFLRRDAPIWGVPSPDGRKLAFVGETTDSNVWLSRQ